jgi:hypothetical protein
MDVRALLATARAWLPFHLRVVTWLPVVALAFALFLVGVQRASLPAQTAWLWNPYVISAPDTVPPFLTTAQVDALSMCCIALFCVVLEVNMGHGALAALLTVQGLWQAWFQQCELSAGPVCCRSQIYTFLGGAVLAAIALAATGLVGVGVALALLLAVWGALVGTEQPSPDPYFAYKWHSAFLLSGFAAGLAVGWAANLVHGAGGPPRPARWTPALTLW